MKPEITTNYSEILHEVADNAWETMTEHELRACVKSVAQVTLPKLHKEIVRQKDIIARLCDDDYGDALARADAEIERLLAENSRLKGEWESLNSLRSEMERLRDLNTKLIHELKKLEAREATKNE